MAAPTFFRRLVIPTIKAASVACLVCHVALTTAFCLPFSPITIALQPILAPTIGRFFPQNWRLFAPEPVSNSYHLLVRCLDVPGAVRARAGSLPDGGWHDISEPMWDAFHRNRFGAYDRLSRPINNAIHQYLFGPPDVSILAKSCGKGSDLDCDMVTKAVEDARTHAAPILQRAATAFCYEQAGRVAFIAVGLRVLEQKAIPWSQRDSSIERSSREYDLGVFPLDPRQVTGGIYR